MAKLYGTADPTLVSAAFKHGVSNVPLDLSKVYKQREKNITDFATGVSALMDSIYQKRTDSLSNAETIGQDVLDILDAEGGVNNEYWTKEHITAIEGLSKELKSLSPTAKGDERRAEIERELKKYSNGMAPGQEMFNKLVANSANGTLLSDLEDNGQLELWNTILGDIKNNTNNANAKYVKGEMTFSLGDKTMTMPEINKALTANDPAYSANFQKTVINPFAALAQQRGGNVTANDITSWRNNAVKAITDWDQVRILENEKLGSTPYSYLELISGQAKNPITGEINTAALEIVYDALDAAGGIDMDGVDGITPADGKLYRDPANAPTLLKKLREDKSKYIETMVGVMGETVIKDVWEQNAKLYKKAKTNDTSTSFFLGKQSVPKSMVTPDVNLLNTDADNIAATTGWNGVQFRKINGQYSIVTNKGWENATRDEVAFALNFDAKVGYKAGGSTTTTTTTTTTPPPPTKVNNNKPSIKGVPYPPRSITASTAGPSKSNIEKLTEMYAAYDVLFSAQGNELLMTGSDGETQSVEMNRYNNANNMESQDLIQQFILNYAK